MDTRSFRRAPILRGSAALVFVLTFGGCPMMDDPGDPNDSGQTAKTFTWKTAFDASDTGALSSVWGTGSDDVFVVGGTARQGEVYHFDGSGWSQMAVPDVGLLVWVFGWAPDNVLAVGVGGGVIRYDGKDWTKIESGVTADLWGVWGPSSTDVWIVGDPDPSGKPTLLHFDGKNLTPSTVPDNDREAGSLFKVWGIGGKAFAVGEKGLIIELRNGAWQPVPTGPDADEDFVSLWGTSEDHIVAVGGRSSARIATYDGTEWKTTKPSGVPGLNGVYLTGRGQAIVGGVNGFLGSFNPETGELKQEESGTNEVIHAVWGDSERTYAVGGNFAPPFRGLALVRADVNEDIPVGKPAPLAEAPDPNEPEAPEFDCNTNGVEDADDIAAGTSSDCDDDGRPDECQADADGDGVINACDVCAGHDDTLDADGDGVPDGCDACPEGDDFSDADNDGAPDACDDCPNGGDTDGDGVCDDVDACPGSDDGLDTDGDGVPNGCDECTGDDLTDSDNDGVADDCDICPGSDDLADADGDGRPDGCDQCPGSNDTLDTDGDGVPNGCDACPGANDALDTDGDGVPNACDICPGGDDNADDDGDGIPNACDVCLAGDDNVDTDNDDVADACDQCPGFDDDGPDLDGDGVMNRCDLGVAVYVLADPNNPASGYLLTEGGTLWVTCGLQGFGDAAFNVVGTGFSNGTPQNGAYVITTRVSLRMEGEQADVGGFNFGLQYPWDAASQTHRLSNIGMFLFAAPATVDNRMGLFRVTLTDPNDGQVRANVTMNVLVRTRGSFCN